MNHETTSKDTSNLKCKNAVVEVKQKFLEIVNTGHLLHKAKQKQEL